MNYSLSFSPVSGFDVNYLFGVEVFFIFICVLVLCIYSKKSNEEFNVALTWVVMMVVSVSFLTAVAWLM